MCDDVYGGTWRLADKVWSRYGVKVDPVDVTDPEAVRAAVSPEAVRERGPVGAGLDRDAHQSAAEDRRHRARPRTWRARPAR